MGFPSNCHSCHKATNRIITGQQDKDEDDGGETLTLVATDGTQHPPFKFPPGQHLALFLQCLEASLAPAFVVQPPIGCNPEIFQDRPAFKQVTYSMHFYFIIS